MKKLFSIVLALVLVLSSVSAFAAEERNKYNELTVVNNSAMTGNFMSTLWGSSTSDIDMQELLHGYPLMVWDNENGVYKANPTVVSGILAVRDAEGNHTYFIALCDDLKYSDGSAITAADYAFSILLASSPEVKALGGAVGGTSAILGADEYLNGKADALAGVKLTGGNNLSVTLRADALPNFFELGLLNFKPFPVKEIAPGCTVKDDGSGVYVSGLTEDVLRASLLNGGYITNPKVVSGPYVLDSFDGETARLSANPNYKGNEKLLKPLITYLNYGKTTNDTMMNDFRSGKVGLINKVVQNDNIQEGIELVRAGGRHAAQYDRSGASFLYFCCEQPEVAAQAVRQAIASCLDVDAAVEAYVGEYGERVNGYYGMGQWMVQKLGGSVDGLKGYELDVDAARKLLADDGWTENADGVMEKTVDGQTVKLELTLGVPEGNAIAEVFKGEFAENLAEAGIKLNVQSIPYAELLKLYYQPGQRDLDMIFMATNFDVNYDPSLNFAPGGVQNYTGIRDEALYQKAVEMAQTESGDVQGYCRKWMDFQKNFMEVLPAIPLYTNTYFDFSTDILRNYNIAGKVSWANAIVEAYLSDAPIDDENGL